MAWVVCRGRYPRRVMGILNRFKDPSSFTHPLLPRTSWDTAILPNTLSSTCAPKDSGSVLDAAGKRVGGAVICIAPADKASEGPTWRITTNLQGRFRRDEETEWYMALFVPADVIEPHFVAIATHNGLHSPPKK